MSCPNCGHDDDPEQGLGSLMMGAGSDWPASTSPPLSDEEIAMIDKIVRDMAYRMGKQLADIVGACFADCDTISER